MSARRRSRCRLRDRLRSRRRRVVSVALLHCARHCNSRMSAATAAVVTAARRLSSDSRASTVSVAAVAVFATRCAAAVSLNDRRWADELDVSVFLARLVMMLLLVLQTRDCQSQYNSSGTQTFPVMLAVRSAVCTSTFST